VLLSLSSSRLYADTYMLLAGIMYVYGVEYTDEEKGVYTLGPGHVQRTHSPSLCLFHEVKTPHALRGRSKVSALPESLGK